MKRYILILLVMLCFVGCKANKSSIAELEKINSELTETLDRYKIELDSAEEIFSNLHMELVQIQNEYIELNDNYNTLIFENENLKQENEQISDIADEYLMEKEVLEHLFNEYKNYKRDMYYFGDHMSLSVDQYNSIDYSAFIIGEGANPYDPFSKNDMTSIYIYDQDTEYSINIKVYGTIYNVEFCEYTGSEGDQLESSIGQVLQSIGNVSDATIFTYTGDYEFYIARVLRWEDGLGEQHHFAFCNTSATDIYIMSAP